MYLFESRAKGTVTPRSDIDLAVSGVQDVFADFEQKVLQIVNV